MNQVRTSKVLNNWLSLIFAVWNMREQERDELLTLLGVEMGTEIREEEVERLREGENRAREVQESLVCAVCQEQEVTYTDL